MKKYYVAKISQGILERFINENNDNYNSCKYSYKFAFTSCLPFRRNQKQEINFHQVGDLVTKNISVFCLWQVTLFFNGVPNSIGFYRRIFLHFISTRLIVPCFYTPSTLQQFKVLINDFPFIVLHY